MRIKVALSGDSRGKSTHSKIEAALKAKDKLGSAYHVYVQYEHADGRVTKWTKVE